MASKVVEAPGGSVPFSIKTILDYLEGGRYIVPILPISLASLIAGRRSAGGSAPKSGGGSSNSGGGGVNKKTFAQVGHHMGGCTSASTI